MTGLVNEYLIRIQFKHSNVKLLHLLSVVRREGQKLDKLTVMTIIHRE